MSLVSHRLQQLLALAEAGLDAATYERAVLGELQGAIGFDIGLFARSSGPGEGAVGLEDQVVNDTRAMWSLFGRELRPVVAAACAEPLGSITDDTVVGSALQRTRRYRQFMAPHRGRSTLIAPLRFGGHCFGVLALGRGAPTFGDVARRALAELLPALRLSEAALRYDAQAAVTSLTEREAELLAYLRLGYGNREIATACGTSPNTVRNQLRGVFRKLGATTRAEAVALSLGHRA